MTAKQALLTRAAKQGWTVTHLLNLLQEHGRISDNCVTFKDVPECDAVTALAWVRNL